MKKPVSRARAAIYARYSSDEQRPESIEDQIEACRRYCETKGFSIVEVYSDAAMSGSTPHRPDYLRMKADAATCKFNVIVTEAIDRLNRRLSETASLLDDLDFHGIKLHTCDNGELAPFMAGILATIAQSYLVDLRHKTKRGMVGKILAGLAASGIAFGYTTDGDKRGARAINEEEAAVVRRIFQLYADGLSPIKIAHQLNDERVRGPQGRPWGDTTIRGQVDRGTGILNNSSYIGKLEWNRCSYTRNPKTGKRTARPNAPEEWESIAVPALRIVEDDLWNRVKARQKAVRTVMTRDENGVALNRSHRTRHLLSGIIVCGECGAPFAMVDANSYRCPNNHRKNTCSNDFRIRRKDIEAAVGEGLKHQLSTTAGLTQCVDMIEQSRAELSDTSAVELARLATAAKAVKRSMDNISNAIALGGDMASLVAKLRDLQTEADEIEAERAAIERSANPSKPFDRDKAVKDIQYILDHMDILFADACDGPETVGAAVRAMIQEILVQPKGDGNYDVFLRGRMAGLMIAAGVLDPAEEREIVRTPQRKRPSAGCAEGLFSVVAGARFELTTFRL